MGMTVGTRL